MCSRTAEKFFSKDDLKNVLLPAIFLSFTLCMFGPLELYMTNVSSFPFQIHELVLASIPIFLFASLLLVIIILLFKKSVFVTGIILGLAMAAYIQGDWMPVSYGEMDGTAIDWAAYGVWPYLNLAIWGVLVLLPVALAIFLRNKLPLKEIFGWIAGGVIAMQCITLAIMLFTMPVPNNQEHYVARDEHMLELSSEKNVIVMLFDAFQASYFQQVIDDMPDAQEIFRDFVFFDNAVGTSLWSEEGSATILTGNQLEAEFAFSDNIDYIYENSEFFPALQENDYDTRYYIQSKLVSSTQRKTISNILEINSGSIPWHQIAKQMSRITAFRYVPHAAKKYFWFSYDDISALKEKRNLDVPEFYESDSTFNKEVLNGSVTAGLEQKVYRLYYFKGMHPPYNLDKNGDYVEYEDENYVVNYVKDIHDNEMMYQQALGSIRIMANFIQALKDLDVYENSNIIITADHGWENRYNPILLIKNQQTTGEFSISHAPVSYISDFTPTILSMIDDNYQGKTVFNYSDRDERERSFYIYSINSNDRSYNDRETLYTYSLNVRPENFRATIERNYQLGSNIIFTDVDDGRRYFTSGISGIETNYAWSLGQSGQMVLYLENYEGDLTGEFCFKSIYAPGQRLVVHCGDSTLFDEEISSPDKLVRFTIPESYIEDGRLTLDLEYPDAVSPKSRGESEDTRDFAFAFESIRFYQSEQ